MDDESSRKVTALMVEAGVNAWAKWEESENSSPKNLVQKIYRAMRDLEGLAARRDQRLVGDQGCEQADKKASLPRRS